MPVGRNLWYRIQADFCRAWGSRRRTPWPGCMPRTLETPGCHHVAASVQVPQGAQECLNSATVLQDLRETSTNHWFAHRVSSADTVDLVLATKRKHRIEITALPVWAWLCRGESVRCATPTPLQFSSLRKSIPRSCGANVPRSDVWERRSAYRSRSQTASRTLAMSKGSARGGRTRGARNALSEVRLREHARLRGTRRRRLRIMRSHRHITKRLLSPE